MNETQAERLIAVLERIADSVDRLSSLGDAIDSVKHEGSEDETFVLNVWKEGETE